MPGNSNIWKQGRGGLACRGEGTEERWKPAQGWQGQGRVWAERRQFWEGGNGLLHSPR